jgi:hypothetical protein
MASADLQRCVANLGRSQAEAYAAEYFELDIFDVACLECGQLYLRRPPSKDLVPVADALTYDLVAWIRKRVRRLRQPGQGCVCILWDWHGKQTGTWILPALATTGRPADTVQLPDGSWYTMQKPGANHGPADPFTYNQASGTPPDGTITLDPEKAKETK